jgi:hypothetical protein
MVRWPGRVAAGGALLLLFARAAAVWRLEQSRVGTGPFLATNWALAPSWSHPGMPDDTWDFQPGRGGAALLAPASVGVGRCLQRNQPAGLPGDRCHLYCFY